MAELKYGVVHRAKVGYKVSGDAYLVKEYADGMLVCLVDGLGSGPKAAEASQMAVDWVANHHQVPLDQMMNGCHEALHNTRGAVMALMRINTRARQLVFMGVGNVEFHAWSAQPMKPISYGGIIGSRLPTLHEFRFPYTPGDLVILHTDGVSRRFAMGDLVASVGGGSPQVLAEAIADDYAKRNDDATLVVVSSVARSGTGVSFSKVEGSYDKNFGSGRRT